jgi:hypothetical protein
MKLLTLALAVGLAAPSTAMAQDATTYGVLATNKAAAAGFCYAAVMGRETSFEALGMTVGQTAIGGAELVVITRRRPR